MANKNVHNQNCLELLCYMELGHRWRLPCWAILFGNIGFFLHNILLINHWPVVSSAQYTPVKIRWSLRLTGRLVQSPHLLKYNH